MKAGNLPRITALALLLAVPVRQAAAQTEVGAQLDLFSSYVWRGLTLTNKPVAQPDVYVSFPAGNASVTIGHWANIDLGKYDDPENDISESGGSSAFNIAELNPYAEVGFSTGKASLTGGVVAYIYPNDDDAPNGGLFSDFNTWEAYGTVGFDVPLAPEFSLYYDFDKIKGAYFQGAVSHSVPLGPSHTLDLGGVIGFNAGQGFSEDDFSFNFADDGLTHVDFSAGVPLTAGVFSITPVVHLQINGDDATKFHSPDSDGSDFKVWGGVSIAWSNAVEEEEGAEEAEVEAPAE
jgi:Bacterial protein of unknown function (Gcw_chp)